MEPMKNLCGLIPESLHKRLMEGKSPEMTLRYSLPIWTSQPQQSRNSAPWPFRSQMTCFSG